jgi:hypothetical protein
VHEFNCHRAFAEDPAAASSVLVSMIYPLRFVLILLIHTIARIVLRKANKHFELTSAIEAEIKEKTDSSEGRAWHNVDIACFRLVELDSTRARLTCQDYGDRARKRHEEDTCTFRLNPFWRP